MLQTIIIVVQFQAGTGHKERTLQGKQEKPGKFKARPIALLTAPYF